MILVEEVFFRCVMYVVFYSNANTYVLFLWEMQVEIYASCWFKYFDIGLVVAHSDVGLRSPWTQLLLTSEHSVTLESSHGDVQIG